MRFGVATAIACLAIAWGQSASAYEVKTAPNGKPIHWTNPSVQFHFDPSIDGAAKDARAAIGAAAQAWSRQEGAPDVSVVDGGGGAKPGYDNLSTIFYAKDGSPLAGGALAVTVTTFDDAGHVLDADIIVNGRYAFDVLDASARPAANVHAVSNEGASHADGVTGAFDLEHVVAHELGHSLGLADEVSDPSATMYLYTAPGDASRRGPTADDAAGLASLYASSADDSTTGAKGCGGATIARRGPTDEASHLAIALVLGLGAWLTLRTRKSGVRFAAPFAAFALAGTVSLTVPSEHVARSAPAVATARGDARARVQQVETTMQDGVFVTRAVLSTTECRVDACPADAVAYSYGGSVGGLHQVVAGVPAPKVGDEVEIALEQTTAPLGEAVHAARLVR